MPVMLDVISELSHHPREYSILWMRKLRLREAKAQNHFFLFSSDALTFGRKTVQSCDKYTVAPEQGTEDQAHHLPATASLENVWSQASGLSLSLM